MRHRVKGRKLSRSTSHRLATKRALAAALLREKKIKTTLAKAKEIRVFVEPMITRAKSGTVAARRIVAKDIHDKEVVKELFNEIITKIGDRPGGYTRVVKLGRRPGDAAEMAIIELVDYNDFVERKKPRKPKTEDAKVVDEVLEETVEEAEVVEEVESTEESEKSEDVAEAVEEITEVEEVAVAEKESTEEATEKEVKAPDKEVKSEINSDKDEKKKEK